MDEVTPIGITDFRNQHQPFGIKQKDRFGHIYVIGKTGTGKTTLLLNMAIDDILKGRGLAIIDPHGDLSNTLLDYIPKERIEDTIYFNAADYEYPIAFNPLYNIKKEDRHLVASELVGTFKKLWSASWGPRLEYILRYSILTLLEYPGATLLDIQPLLTDAQFRSTILSHITNSNIIAFWKQEFDKYPLALRSEAITPVLNKVGLFNSSSILRNIVGQPQSSFEINEVINSSRILICNLSKGEIGEDASALLGSMLVSAIQFAALRRSKVPEGDRIPFFLYIDEMHSFVSLSLADILAEARKYKLSLFIAHQYLDQLHEKLRSAIFGNVGTIITFRIGLEDAKILGPQFYPVFDELDLVNIPRYTFLIKLMIDGLSARPFNGLSNSLSNKNSKTRMHIVATSRCNYACNPNTGIRDSHSRDDQDETPTPSLF